MERDEYTLVGVNGNSFSIIGAVRRWMRHEGFSAEEIEAYTNNAKSSDYHHLVAVSMEMTDKLNERHKEREKKR